MPSTTPNSSTPQASPGSLESFVEGIVGQGRLRVEEDLGQGFVRLKSSEAERRQAAQDIRCSEDVVLEMLRNARDAGAKHVFLATGREGGVRSITVVDDGGGIPEAMHERVFQPRVTSKLDSAKLDKWGIHGRGMALYSISENTDYASVQRSEVGLGASIKVRADSSRLPERADQSAFPVFERTDSGYSMRGPRNILRTAAEFAFEHRGDLAVYCGTETEVAAALYEHGVRTLPASKRLFGEGEGVPLALTLSMARDDRELAQAAERLGLDISVRSARRILDGEIAPPPSLMERLQAESFPDAGRPAKAPAQADGEGALALAPRPRSPRISASDLAAFEEEAQDAFRSLAEKYYLEPVAPRARQRGAKLRLEFDVVEKNS